MAARKRKGTKDVPMPDSWRKKIQATEIMTRMQSFFFGELQLSGDQLRAAQIILGKVIPDLARTDTTVTINPHESALDELK
jgi:hypothetical protein